jgi:hypothetical protein
MKTVKSGTPELYLGKYICLIINSNAVFSVGVIVLVVAVVLIAIAVPLVVVVPAKAESWRFVVF